MFLFSTRDLFALFTWYYIKGCVLQKLTPPLGVMLNVTIEGLSPRFRAPEHPHKYRSICTISYDLWTVLDYSTKAQSALHTNKPSTSHTHSCIYVLN